MVRSAIGRRAAMEPLVLSTEGIPAREQFELWRGLGDRHLLSPALGA